jgi:large subunit ribosomal protein L18
MKKIKLHNEIIKRREARVRAKVKGTSERPRLSVFRSNTYLYSQIIDDSKHQTLASGSTKENKSKTNKTKAAELLGKELADKALKAGVKKIVFDRGSYRYHGRVKALADSLRTNGLEF